VEVWKADECCDFKDGANLHVSFCILSVYIGVPYAFNKTNLLIKKKELKKNL
jgi:hypothetical protein